MGAVLQDVRYALRSLRRSPAFTSAAVLTLATGIGATTGAFSLANAVVLKPLPFESPDGLVRVYEVTPEGEPFPVSEPTFLHLQTSSQTLPSIAAVAPRRLTLTGRSEPVSLRAAAVSASFFDVLGVRPAQGRGFVAGEDRKGASPVVVISHSVWQQRLGAAPDALGGRLQLDGTSYEIVGILPSHFTFLPFDLWVPLQFSPESDPTNHTLDVIGRLASDATLDMARAELAVVAERDTRTYPEHAGWGLSASALSDWLVGPSFRRTVWVLLGSVAFLLLLACANVANLLMARGTYRRDELGIRSALGARRLELVRQLLVESLILAGCGGLLGVLGSAWIVSGLEVLTSDLVVNPATPAIDGRVLIFTAVVVLLAAIGFGVAPAWYASDVQTATGRHGSRLTLRSRRTTELFVVVQIALATLLLVGSGLMIRSFVRLQSVDTGFEATGVIAVPLALPERTYSPERAQAFFEALISRLESMPGISAAGATSTNPFREWGFSNNVTPEDRAGQAPASGLLQAGWRAVTPGFFEALQVPLRAGRTFTQRDRPGARVAVLSESLAAQLWPGGDAVGRRTYWGGIEGRPWTVVGVVGDVRDLRVDAEPGPTMYVPHVEVPMSGMTILLRTPAGAAALAAQVRREIHALAADLPVPEVRALQDNRADAMNVPRARALLMTLVGAMALLLASIGLYGLIAFGAAQRMQEIGIRIALGATPGNIVQLFLTRGLGLAAAGLAAGLAGASLLSRTLEALLFETDAREPGLFAAAAVVLAAVTALASYIPARRAATLDPVSVLNRE